MPPKPFFVILKSFLGDFGEPFGRLLEPFNRLLERFAAFLWKCLGDRSGTAFGSILVSFCTDFMNIFCVMLEVFLAEKVVLPARQRIVQKFIFICSFVCRWQTFQK